MYHEPVGKTSGVLVRKIAQATMILEEAFALPLPITRDDDWALTSAYHALKTVVDNQNSQGVQS
jgi:hypothetical protein